LIGGIGLCSLGRFVCRVRWSFRRSGVSLPVRPFNISLGGVDRNLDDVSNDRPNYSGDTRLLRWRKPGESADSSLFSIPAIGQSGNLPRNAGIGPGLFVFDLNVTREFQLGRVKLRSIGLSSTTS
jgi:hypothetical protein